ncbi:MAG: valine--tRNA ligase [Bdellovibrionaceae bacterium]|nr:valine--tRNA ligase [Pseudobdellovibrionaceae bacterium]
MSLPDRYNPQEVEQKTYQWWEEQGYFKAEDVSTKPPFCIILPPPNVTGSLHLGHALDQSIQDCLTRWKRMHGYNALWLPGTDHAGIATQSVVEKQLAKEKLSRKEMGREAFVKRVWQWKEQYGGRIVEQMKRLGSSCDWDRHTFTLDSEVSKAVRKVFVNLYNEGLIYKGTRLINWSPKLESALSDLEVDHEVVNGHLWHIRYPFSSGEGDVVVATTRPETMLGDSAVAVNPNDERYTHLIGKKIKLPLTNREIELIADDYVDKEFGSGAVKITPAHDFNDYNVGQRHNLELINILNKNGTLNEAAGTYQGLKVQEARKQVVADLEKQGFLVKVEAHKHSVGHCSRSHCIVEPFLSDQWFVKTSELATPARHVVENGTTEFIPESWTKTYLHWLGIIQDWCISRQLWWGHRIPAWTCSDCGQLIVSEQDPKSCIKCESKNIIQEEDVLDTWFSSALWPFSTLGWPQETEALKTFYPTDVLVTGHDIIFFWVARMMMAGLKFKKDVPFRTIYIHGLIRDAKGQKMSKSLNNSVDPLEIIDKQGADALRFTLLSQLASGKDLKFSEQRLEGCRNFMNKIWNAARFSLTALENFDPVKNQKIQAKDLSDADKWIIYKMSKCIEDVDAALNNYRFSDAANAVYTFAWHEFCDWYLEFIKPVIYGEDNAEKAATQKVLAETLNRLMRLLHPFIPFISEEIYQKLPIKGEACIVDSYPTLKNDKEWLSLGVENIAFEVDLVREVITAVRNIRGENRIKPGEKITVRLVVKDDDGQKILSANKVAIMTLSRLESCEIGEAGSLSKCAVTPIKLRNIEVEVIVPLEGLVDFDEEINRLNKTIEKTQKEISTLSNRLENKNFVENAPAEVVEQGRQQLTDLNTKLQSMIQSLTRLK